MWGHPWSLSRTPPPPMSVPPPPTYDYLQRTEPIPAAASSVVHVVIGVFAAAHQSVRRQRGGDEGLMAGCPRQWLLPLPGRCQQKRVHKQTGLDGRTLRVRGGWWEDEGRVCKERESKESWPSPALCLTPSHHHTPPHPRHKSPTTNLFNPIRTKLSTLHTRHHPHS